MFANIQNVNKNAMGVIELKNMEFYAYHGCYAEEQVVGNRFLVTLKLDAPCSKAAETDSIEDAVNYQQVFLVVKEQMEIKSHLLENVAKRILENVMVKFPTVAQAKVKVSKLMPPLGGEVDKVSVTMTMQRSDCEINGKN